MLDGLPVAVGFFDDILLIFVGVDDWVAEPEGNWVLIPFNQKNNVSQNQVMHIKQYSPLKDTSSAELQ